jgi:hypothetical protein
MVEEKFVANTIEFVERHAWNDCPTNFLDRACCDAASDAHALNRFGILNV